MPFARKIQAPVASLLLVGLLAGVMVLAVPAPQPARAQLDITSCFSSILGFFGIDISGLLGSALGSLGISIGLEVPVRDSGVRAQTTIANTSTNNSSCINVIVTALLKTAIALVRDMVIRWIVTGNFGAPVFSTSFVTDLSRAAENASRIFLSQLTGLNFCAGSAPLPPQAFFNVNLSIYTRCTFSGSLDDFYSNRTVYRYGQFASAFADENFYWSKGMAALAAKTQEEAYAREAFRNEYQAGRGFFCIKNSSGQCTTPGSAVAELVMQSQIVSPIRQTDVADDVQTAIAAIINTAIQTLINQGLTSVFGP